jgi:hypothetical protein
MTDHKEASDANVDTLSTLSAHILWLKPPGTSDGHDFGPDRS